MKHAPASNRLRRIRKYTVSGSSKSILLNLIVIFLFMAGGWLSYAGAQSVDDSPHPASMVILKSPYLNEKGSVKAYHRELTFHFISWTNSTKSYLIKADTIILDEGNFTNYRSVLVEPRNKIIRHLRVYIDDNLSLEIRNMVIYNLDYYNAPDEDDGGFGFLGYTWSEIVTQRWKIFRAVLVGSIISLFILGRIFMYYWRKTRGEEIIVSSY